MIRQNLPSLIFLTLALALSGCSQLKGVRYLQGDSTVIGIGLPLESGQVQIQAYSGLSGQKLEVDRNAAVSIRCTTAQTNTYFGVVRTESAYFMEADIAPRENSPQSGE